MGWSVLSCPRTCAWQDQVPVRYPEASEVCGGSEQNREGALASEMPFGSGAWGCYRTPTGSGQLWVSKHGHPWTPIWDGWGTIPIT